MKSETLLKIKIVWCIKNRNIRTNPNHIVLLWFSFYFKVSRIIPNHMPFYLAVMMTFSLKAETICTANTRILRPQICVFWARQTRPYDLAQFDNSYLNKDYKDNPHIANLILRPTQAILIGVEQFGLVRLIVKKCSNRSNLHKLIQFSVFFQMWS